MPSAAAIAADEELGRIEPRRLGVRVGQRNAAPAGGSAPITEAPAVAGETRAGPFGLRVSVHSEGPAARVEASVRNASEQPQRLESLVLGYAWTGGPSASLRFLQNGWQSWSFTGPRVLDSQGERPFPSGPWLRGMHHALGEPPADRRGWHESHLITLVGESPGGAACLAGVFERGESFALVYLRKESGAVRVEVELRVDAELAPGEERSLETVWLRLGKDANALLEGYAEAYGRAADARTAHPFAAGWCSWYHFFHDVSEADLLRNLEALAAARDELPVEFVQLDDGWQRAVGDWLETNEKFPRGLAAVAAAIRDAGFVPGLWTAPFCAVRESRLFAEHADWLLGRDGELHRGLVHPQWSADAAVYVLDTSRSEVSDHLSGLARAHREMGFHYLKLDFLYAAAMRAPAADPGLSPAGRLRRGLEALRAGAGHEAFLLGCGAPLGPSVGLVDAMRVGPDVAPVWSTPPDHAIPGIEETQPAVRSALRNSLARLWTHRRLWINDPDCLLARDATELSDAERRSLAATVGAAGGLAFFSDDVAELSAERRALVRDTLDAARALDGLGLPGRGRVLDPLSDAPLRQVVARSAGLDIAALVNLGGDDETVVLEVEGALGGAPRPRLGGAAPEWDTPGLELRLDAHDGALVELPRGVSLAVFCDFDGTFSVQDVGASLAIRHAGERRPGAWKRYESGELTAWDYNMLILEDLPAGRADVEAFLDGVELDPGARELLRWCEEQGVPFHVLSDGFDFNLNRLQQIHSVSFSYTANHLRFEEGRWRIGAGAAHPACECGCGICKRARIEAYRTEHPGVTIVHVGNGRVSDTCGALAADVAFAKDSLAEALAERGVGYEPFETLHDVIPALARLL